MANLMITTACNFRCDYCFGLDMIGPGRPSVHMTWETYLKLMDWIDQAGLPEQDVHLMGGEPTLSPLFDRMLRDLIKRGRRAAVFSNASTPVEPEALGFSRQSGVRWVVNVNHPDQYQPDQLELLHRNLAELGAAAVITFNLTGPDADFDYVFENIERFDLARSIKIGVTLPTLEKSNVFVDRQDFPGIAEKIMDLLEQAQKHGVGLEFECGVPYCLFNPEQHRRLGPEVYVSHCGSRLDITPEGDVINCLPLCRAARVPYTEFKDYGAAREWFRRAFAPYRRLGGDVDCLGCADHEAGRCGACLAYGLGQFNRVALPPLPGLSPREAGPC